MFADTKRKILIYVMSLKLLTKSLRKVLICAVCLRQGADSQGKSLKPKIVYNFFKKSINLCTVLQWIADAPRILLIY